MTITIKRTGLDQFMDPAGGAWIKCLIMGDHGVGKTPSAAQWPKPIIADCEKGLLSVAKLAVPYAEIESTQDMSDLIQHLKLDSRKAALNRSYQTLVIDTIDTYQRKMIMERLAKEKKEALSGWADWGWLDGKMAQLMEAIISLNMNVVVNMHTKEISSGDDDDRQLVTKARLKGDIKDSIFQEFDLIGRMETAYEAGTGEQKGQRVQTRQIRWHGEPRFPALRDRSNSLPRFTPVTFTPADYTVLFDYIVADIEAIPESADVETVGTAATPVEGATGGPAVTEIPAAKPVKKAAAKKAAPAAKTAAATPAPEPAAAPVEAPVEPRAGDVADLQDLGATKEEAIAGATKAGADEKAEMEIELYDMPARIEPCPLVLAKAPHNFQATPVARKNGVEVQSQICTGCHVRKVDLTSTEAKQQEALLSNDPWQPPAEGSTEKATEPPKEPTGGTADADAAEQLLSEQLGAEPIDEAAEVTQDIAGIQTNGKGTALVPVFLPGDLDMAKESRVLESLDHVHLPDGTCRKNTFGPLCSDEAPEEATAAPAAAAPEAKPGAPKCGDQPPSMVGKREALPGCGNTLDSKVNASRAQIAMLRLGTYLCDTCHGAVA